LALRARSPRTSALDFQYTRLDDSVFFGATPSRGQMTYDMITPYTPEERWSFGIQNAWSTPKRGSFTARVDASYRGEVYTQAQPLNDRKTAYIGDYTLTHAQLTWHAATGD
jgi:hypothetical protein